MSAAAVEQRRLFPGAELFRLKDSRGLPLALSLDRVMNEAGLVVEWPSFIEAARAQGWLDSRILREIVEGLVDADVPRDLRDGIEARTKLYMSREP